MATTRPRPLSPHLTIWRWGPNMTVSILHRATGVALSIGGLAVLTWWLLAVAEGPDAYAGFSAAARHPIGIIVLVGLTWSFFQHLFSGLRHLVLDIGAGYELRTNRFWSIMTLAGSVVLTIALWVWIIVFRSA